MSTETLPVTGSRFLSSLPGDTQTENRPRQVSGALYSTVRPTPVSASRLLLCSPSLCADFGFDADFCHSERFARLMSGNELFPGISPFATRYGGHQFGNWAGQLGDGRAINLGELPVRDGRLMNLQLKGAGPTPYSRGADGRAVLRSSLREFLCSEAMHFLGVPTTRALSLVLSGDEVMRDMFYDGNPQDEPGAIVCRVAPSFTRFGHFQLCAYRGEETLLYRLLHQCIHDDFPHLSAPSLASEQRLPQEIMLRWFEEVCERTAIMVAHWMSLGFVHGVMNTDNMSVLGLSIDYGPYGWLDHYDPQWTPNTTDAVNRRYRYEAQPDIALWNLYQLANAVLPVLQDVPSVEAILKRYPVIYENAWLSMMGRKLGVQGFGGQEDQALLSDLLAVLQLRETDMSLFFRALAQVSLQEQDVHDDIGVLAHAFYGEGEPSGEHRNRLARWLHRYAERVHSDAQEAGMRRTQMEGANPWFILRNYLVQEALDLAQEGDFSRVHQLHAALQEPYKEHRNMPDFHRKRPEWARHRAGASMLSCSS